MVKIYIVDLSVMCLIGIYPEERTKKQKLIFNIEIHSSSSPYTPKCDNNTFIHIMPITKTINSNIGVGIIMLVWIVHTS